MMQKTPFISQMSTVEHFICYLLKFNSPVYKNVTLPIYNIAIDVCLIICKLKSN